MTTDEQIRRLREDEQIRRLREEAEMVDAAQVSLCNLALTGDLAARAKCAATIDAARAADDSERSMTRNEREHVAYYPNRSPTGIATAGLAILDGDDVWRTVVGDRRVELPAGTELHLDGESATNAARHIWACNGGRRSIRRPVPFARVM